MDILTKYNVVLKSSDIFKSKSISTCDDALTSYLVNHYSLSDAKRLLDGVYKVLSNEIPLAGGTSRGMVEGVIEKYTAKFYISAYDYWQDESIAPDFVLPTSDFKMIVEAWVQFLEQED